MSLRAPAPAPRAAGRLNFVLQVGKAEVGCGSYGSLGRDFGGGGQWTQAPVEGFKGVGVEKSRKDADFKFFGVKSAHDKQDMEPVSAPAEPLRFKIEGGDAPVTRVVAESKEGYVSFELYDDFGVALSLIKCRRGESRDGPVYSADYVRTPARRSFRVSPSALLHDYLEAGCAHFAKLREDKGGGLGGRPSATHGQNELPT